MEPLPSVIAGDVIEEDFPQAEEKSRHERFQTRHSKTALYPESLALYSGNSSLQQTDNARGSVGTIIAVP